MTHKLNVDKARFLAVAAALAGLATFQACSNGDDGSDADDGGSAGTSSTAGTQSTAGAQSAAGSDSDGEGGASAGSAGTAAGGSTAGAMAGGAANGGASEGGASGASQGSAGAGMTCSDSEGAPLCDEVSEACLPYCNAATQKLKSAVAVAAIDCLKADVSEGCAGGYDCLTAATAAACTEDVATPCEIAGQNCMNTDPGKPSCEQLVSAFNDEARAEMLLCLEMYCDSPYTCAEGFFFDSGT